MQRGVAMIDAYVSHLWATVEDIAPYLEPGWQEALLRGNKAQRSLRVPPLYVDPRGPGSYRNWKGASNRGLELDAVREEILDGTGAERVVLGYEEGLGAAAYQNQYLGLAICRALNDWTLAEWVARDERLYALALVPTNIPEGAAEEIRRIGKNKRVVGVMLGANILGVPYGMNIYDPIYEAAVEMDLPIVLHVKADIASTMATPQTAGGLVSTYAEYQILCYQSPASHIVSMIAQGVFDIYPSLKVVVVGGSAGWIPAQAWRMDWAYGYSSNDAPWLTRLPSEYFGEHVRVTSYGLEKPRQPERLAQLLKTMPWFHKALIHASGYPSIWGCEALDELLARIPEEWHEGVLRGNAMDTFRWPDRPISEKPKPTLLRSAMPGPKTMQRDLAGIARGSD
jgi:predicted TIM-barrel fold metal-dependent hydrolase